MTAAAKRALLFRVVLAWLACLLAGEASSGSDTVPTFGAPRPLNTNASGDSGEDLNAQIAADGDTWIAVWQSDDPLVDLGSDFDVLFARSTDAGANWTAPAPLDPSAASDAGDDMDPQIVSDGAGNWLALWPSDDPAGGTGGDFDLLVSRSSDSGLSWTPATPLNTNATTDQGRDFAPQVASDGLGSWVAVWQSNEPTGGSGPDFDILVARSGDGGITWSAPVPLSPDAAVDLRNDNAPRIRASATGTWIAVWQADELANNFLTDEDVLASRSTDAGLTWSTPVLLNTNDFDGEKRHDDYDPELATDGAGNWVVVFASNDSNDFTDPFDPFDPLGFDVDILTTRSTDDGVSWEQVSELNSSAAIDVAGDFDPQVSYDGTGRWTTVWQSTNAIGGIAADWDVLVSHSTDAGDNWTPPKPLHAEFGSDAVGDFDPQLVRDGAGAWVAVWYQRDPVGRDTDIVLARGSGPFGPNAPLTAQAAGDSGPDLSPRIQTDGSGGWVAVWQSLDSLGGTIGGDLDVLVSYSTDGGHTWSARAPLDPGAATDSASDSHPKLATDGAGTWLVVWESTDPSGGAGSDSDLKVSTSTDGGATWTAPSLLNTTAGSDTGADIHPEPATDGAGTWLVVWQSDHPLSGSGSDTDIFAATSTDAGASWSEPVPVNSQASVDSGEDLRPGIATDRLGTWQVVWESYDAQQGVGFDADIFTAASFDAGASFSASVPLNANAASDSGEDRRPRIAAGAWSTWVVVWESNEDVQGVGTDSDILFSRQIFFSPWSAPAAVDAGAAGDSGNDVFAEIASDWAGGWTVVWQSDDSRSGTIGNDTDLLVARTQMNGFSSWQTSPLNADTAVDTGGDFTPDLATDELGTWLVAFASSDSTLHAIGADADILFARGAGADQDGDGLSNAAEVNLYGTATYAADHDGDGLMDGDEVDVHGSDPRDVDSDGDTLSDADEVLIYTSSPTSVDTDADQVPDLEEITQYLTSPTVTDTDEDGLDDFTEIFEQPTNPLIADTDDDGLDDGDEVLVHGTDPIDPDSDDDGFEDGEEVGKATNPLDPLSFPMPRIPALAPRHHAWLWLTLLSAGLLGLRRAAGRRSAR